MGYVKEEAMKRLIETECLNVFSTKWHSLYSKLVQSDTLSLSMLTFSSFYFIETPFTVAIFIPRF